jgi:hypothetical protein
MLALVRSQTTARKQRRHFIRRSIAARMMGLTLVRSPSVLTQ